MRSSQARTARQTESDTRNTRISGDTRAARTGDAGATGAMGSAHAMDDGGDTRSTRSARAMDDGGDTRATRSARGTGDGGDTRSTRPATRGARAAGGASQSLTVLGRYQLHRRLGSGAFGTVWMASDERLERDVAVKILPRERIVGGRFEREARAAARLSHPGIVTLYEAAVDDEGAYLVSELVRGTTLDELLAGGHLSDRDILSIGVVLCDALEHAHAEGVVHRDVKPSNVLVPARPVTSAQVAKLTDFGVARVVGGDALTLTGDVVGTLAYMAPEQAEGLQAGAAADLYSLALVLYEALTGVNPVRTTAAAHRARRLGAHLPPLRRQRRDLPRELGQGIDMALRPRPRERGRIRDLRRALVAAREHVGDQPGVVQAPWTARGRETSDGQLTDRHTSGREPLSEDQPETPSEEHLDGHAATSEPWQARGLAALGAAACAAWLSSHVLGSSVPGPLAALAAAGLVLFLPRLGWLALALSISAGAIAQGHSSLALVTLLALALPVVLLVTRPLDWPLAVGAPALGLIGLAGAWPAVAAQAASAWRRAALAAIGWVWLLFAGVVSGGVLYLPRIPGTIAVTNWWDSPTALINQVLSPILRSGALAPALVWALAAVVLPWLVRGRSLAFDLVRVVIWAAILESATVTATRALNGSGGVHAAPTAVTGAVVAGALALGVVWLSKVAQGWRPEPHSASSGGQFP